MLDWPSSLKEEKKCRDGANEILKGILLILSISSIDIKGTVLSLVNMEKVMTMMPFLKRVFLFISLSHKQLMTSDFEPFELSYIKVHT